MVFLTKRQSKKSGVFLNLLGVSKGLQRRVSSSEKAIVVDVEVKMKSMLKMSKIGTIFLKINILFV